MTNEERPNCPKCGRKMTHGKDTRGKHKWRCAPGGRHCYATVGDPRVVTDQSGNERKPGPPPKFRRPLGDSKIFVVTCAQNATPVHEGFWNALMQYCRARDAQLLVLPSRYKNATSVWTASQKNEEWWLDPPAPPYEIRDEQYQKLSEAEYKELMYPRRKYLWNVRRKLNDNLIVLGDIPVQPTAVVPLSGFESITHRESGILGHTKVQFKTIPTVQGQLPKIMTTTGACTERNFTNTRLGKLGEFHHTLGAVVVEVVNSKVFHLRQINASRDTGEFFDIPDGMVTLFKADGYQTRGENRRRYRPLGISLGDQHIRGVDKVVERVTFDEIIPQLDPEVVLFHDLLDGQTVNHWGDRNPFISTARSFGGIDNVRDEVFEAINYPQTKLGLKRQAVIVPSNHNDWLHRWIKEQDWRGLSPKNRAFYLSTALLLQAKAEQLDPDTAERLNAFIEIARHSLEGTNVKVLDYAESFRLKDIECGLHGHLGPNGSKGSARNYARIGAKTIGGDCHSPEIFEGAWRGGTSSKLLRGYNPGPSGWLNTHVLVYPNGKRTMITVINGLWRL